LNLCYLFTERHARQRFLDAFPFDRVGRCAELVRQFEESGGWRSLLGSNFRVADPSRFFEWSEGLIPPLLVLNSIHGVDKDQTPSAFRVERKTAQDWWLGRQLR
jgi:hypothetical protein